jgi:hypothetical protein
MAWTWKDICLFIIALTLVLMFLFGMNITDS